MRKLFSILLIGSAIICVPVCAENNEVIRNATQAAQLWLTSADAGHYDETWEQAAPVFQQTVTKAEWEFILRVVRTTIGDLKNRSVVSVAFAEKLPGARTGKYVVIQYASEYTKKAEVIETVVPMLNEDGIWKVSGYFVK
ncbi:DUF4019 domain-containing protein [Duganella qianjiadongensis]|uniref:DUF4019 domain-containing protein n=1 Tax=Duganella qianjiadongensis TaxID=2692176 RepID=A0ABW9VP07_9BURK|nr:DUF4019 domain-containing protein [Duganella qianjiadongensis]MYM39437.1 DUF4019 domain-containing protein [Duganella qianjiadongensis]